MKDKFIFYKSFYEAIMTLETDDEKLDLITGLMEFNFETEEYKFKYRHTKAMFKIMQPLIDNATRKYQSCIENGRKGGNPNFKKGQPNPYYQSSEKITQDNLNKNNNINNNININNNSESVELSKITPTHNSPLTTPTLSELRSYCYENNMEDFDYEYFYNYYEATEWIDKNGNQIKNWKNKLRNWYKRDEEKGRLKMPEDSRRLG